MADGLIRLFEEQIVGGYADSDTVIELTDVTDLVGETPVTLAIFRTNDGNAKQAFDAGNYEEWHLAAEGDINETDDKITVTRGYNSTTAQTIASGDTWKVYNYVNPPMWDDKASLSGPNSFTGLQEFDQMPQVSSIKIVETGSNSDGRWLRFSNGIQITWRTYVHADTNQTWNFGMYRNSNVPSSSPFAADFDSSNPELGFMSWAVGDGAVTDNAAFTAGYETDIISHEQGPRPVVLGINSVRNVSQYIVAIGRWF